MSDLLQTHICSYHPTFQPVLNSSTHPYTAILLPCSAPAWLGSRMFSILSAPQAHPVLCFLPPRWSLVLSAHKTAHLLPRPPFRLLTLKDKFLEAGVLFPQDLTPEPEGQLNTLWLQRESGDSSPSCQAPQDSLPSTPGCTC